MRIEFTATGWIELTTKNIVIRKKGGKPLMTVDAWIKVNNRLGFTDRQNCTACKRKWEALVGNVNILFTNKGNKVVCDPCFGRW